VEDTVIVVFNNDKSKQQVDIEIPLNITVRELIIGLNKAYALEINTDNIQNCYLKVDKPLMLLRGNMLLKDTGIRTGSVISF